MKLSDLKAYNTLLLNELEHRIKNIFQIVISFLNLQKSLIIRRDVKDELNKSIQRITGIFRIYDGIYKPDSLSEIEFDRYIEGLINEIEEGYKHKNVKVEIKIPKGFTLHIDQAIPLGLIANELIINAYEHAFSSTKSDNKLTVKIKEKNGEVNFTVNDNGLGLDSSIKIGNTDSLGFMLVNGFIFQLQGLLTVKRNGGTKFIVVFSRKKYPEVI